MRNIILAVGAILLLVGCTSKEEKTFMQSYEKNRFYYQQLQKTEKTQLYDGNITKAVLTATYINKQNIDKEYKPDEVFIIGIYIEENIESEEVEMSEDSNNTKKRLFHKEGYILKLNGKHPKSIQKLEIGDPVLKHISFISEWSEYYLVTFPHISSKSFKLVFKSELYGKGKLHFAKVAKYVLSKKAF